MSWFHALQPAAGDPEHVARVRRSARSWLALNLGVLLLPVGIRAAVSFFGGDNVPVAILHLEEWFFFSLFLSASVLVEFQDHLTNWGGDPADSKLQLYFTALLFTGVFLAVTYGLAFSGAWPLELHHVILLVTFMIWGAGLSLDARLYLVETVAAGVN